MELMERISDGFSTLAAPEPLRFACTECGAKLKFAREHAGKQVRCPRCQKVVTIPSA